MFLTAVSGGLVALGLMAMATRMRQSGNGLLNGEKLHRGSEALERVAYSAPRSAGRGCGGRSMPRGAVVALSIESKRGGLT
jgi:hypothetical protein